MATGNVYRNKILYEFSLGVPVNLKPEMFVPFEKAKFTGMDNKIDNYEDEYKGFKFTNHQVEFEVLLSTERQGANTCQVTIINLDDNPVNYAVANGNNSLSAFLKVGDNVQGVSTIFQGIVTKVDDLKQGETRRTTFILSDAGFNLKNAFTVRSWAKGTSLNDIAKDLAKDLNLPIGKLCIMPEKTTANLNYSSTTKRVVDNIFSGKGYEMSVVNGYVNFTKRGSKYQFIASHISKDSGLIGKVSSFVDNTAKGMVTDKESEKIKFSCLIDNSIIPEETVYVSDGEFEGAYKVREVVFRGNYEGNLWTCDVIASVAKGVTQSAI